VLKKSELMRQLEELQDNFMPKLKGIYQRGKGFYGTKWYKGKTYTTRIYPTAQEASDALAELVDNLQKGLQHNKKNITVAEFIDIFIKKYLIQKPRIQKIIIINLKSRLYKGIVPFIGKKKLQSLTPEILQELQNRLFLKYAESMAIATMRAFKQVLKRAVVWEYLVHDPSQGLDIFTPVINKPVLLTLDQVESILEDKSIDLRERTVVGLGALAGLRRSEVFGLTWDKIEFKSHIIKIDMQYCTGEYKRPKYGSPRAVPILPELEHLLKEYRLQSGSMDWVFPSQMRQPMDGEGWVEFHFKAVLKKHGLPVVKFHTLRHLFDAAMYDAGVSTCDVMQMMGHKSAKMTLNIYDRSSPDHLVRTVRNLRLLRPSADRLNKRH
jgi:integrase